MRKVCQRGRRRRSRCITLSPNDPLDSIEQLLLDLRIVRTNCELQVCIIWNDVRRRAGLKLPARYNPELPWLQPEQGLALAATPFEVSIFTYSRLTMDWSRTTIWLAVTIGSMQSSGIEPCPPLPNTRIDTPSTAAKTGPAVKATVPAL